MVSLLTYTVSSLIGKEIIIGDVRTKAHRLCDPCKYLQKKLLNQKKLNHKAKKQQK